MTDKKRPAVFLDRDGVLIREKSYIRSMAEMDIFPYADACVKQIKEKGYYAIVITNQSGIARGLFTERALWEMNEHLIDIIGVDAIYYCPHHPNGIVDQYKKVCNCRKPEIGLLEQAIMEYSIDRSRSYMVGDRATDILAGQRAGIKTVLLESGYGTKQLEYDIMPDYVMTDLRNVSELL